MANFFPRLQGGACGMWILNHKPIIIHPLGIPQWRQKPWRFEQVWLGEEGSHNTMNLALNINSPCSPIAQVEAKIGSCQIKLQKWCKQCFGNITCELVEKIKLLKVAEILVQRGSRYENILNLKRGTQGLLMKKEQL